ncbi:MAG: archease [Deltaproteobacteria bacterium]|nr:archease [Deltaproteobacteria bacterium]
MSYTYFEHVSDVCLRAEGTTLAGAIESGAEAMFNVSFDLETITERETVAIRAEARTPELLFVEVLNECLSLQAIGELALKRLLTQEIKKLDKGLSYTGVAYGEAFDRDKHTVRTEVKGATYSGLTYNNGKGGTHVLTCVLDV